MARKESLALTHVSRPREAKSAARDGLGGDHPRFRAEPHAVKRSHDVKQMARGHFVPTAALHAESGEKRHQRRIAEFGSTVDLATPCAFAIEVRTEPTRQAICGSDVEATQASQPCDQEARFALSGAGIIADEVLDCAAAHFGF